MAAKYDYTTIGAPACGMAGWGCPNTKGGDWWSDGYDTAEQAVWAAHEAVRLVAHGVDFDLALRTAAARLQAPAGLWR